MEDNNLNAASRRWRTGRLREGFDDANPFVSKHYWSSQRVLGLQTWQGGMHEAYPDHWSWTKPLVTCGSREF